jgi:hypothetical protein
MTVSDSLHSLLDYECPLFFMTNLVLSYESVTSSASVVRWLTLHSWTLDFPRMTYDWIIELSWTELNPRMTAPLRMRWVESESYITTDGPSPRLSWNKAHIWCLRPDFYYCQTVAVLLMSGALSDERTGLSLKIAAGPRQRSHSRVRVPWDSRPYFTVSDSRLSILSPPTTPGLRWRYSTPPPHETPVANVKFKVKARILRPTVSRAVYLGIKHPSWAQHQIFITVEELQVSCCGALCLTRGLVYRLPESQSSVISLLSDCTICILHVTKCMYIQHIQSLCQSRLSTADHALSLVAPATTPV